MCVLCIYLLYSYINGAFTKSVWMHFKCLNWITAAALIWYLTLQRVHNVQITCHYYFHFDDSICWVCVFIYRWSIKCGIYTIALPFNNECNQSAASWVGSIEAIWQAPYRNVNILTMYSQNKTTKQLKSCIGDQSVVSCVYNIWGQIDNFNMRGYVWQRNNEAITAISSDKSIQKWQLQSILLQCNSLQLVVILIWIHIFSV